MAWRALFLAHRAKERRAAGLHDAPDRAAAAGRRAWLALAVIDAEIVLEIAELAVGAAMVAQRRAAGRDRVLEHRLDRSTSRSRALVRRAGARRDGRGACAWATAARGAAPRRHRCCRARRPRVWSSSAALRLVFLPWQARASIAASNSLPSGSGPSARSSGSSSSSARGTSFIEPKRRGSLKRDRSRPTTCGTRRGRARASLRALVVIGAGRRRAAVARDAERARHAEMHQQHVAGGEIGEQIFGAPAEPGRRSGLRAARRNPSAAASADRRGAPRPWRSARPP